MGVIKKIDNPTAWCAGMVVVPKKDGKIRICVNLKPLNECVLREIHPLPKVEDTLAELSGEKCVQQVGRQFWFLADILSQTFPAAHNLHNSIWVLPLYEDAFRDIQCPRTLPEANDSNPFRS